MIARLIVSATSVAILAGAPTAIADPVDPTVQWLIQNKGQLVCSSFGPTYDATASGDIMTYLAHAHPVRHPTYMQVAEAMLGSTQRFCPQYYLPLVQDAKQLKIKGFEELWGGVPSQDVIR